MGLQSRAHFAFGVRASSQDLNCIPALQFAQGTKLLILQVDSDFPGKALIRLSGYFTVCQAAISGFADEILDL